MINKLLINENRFVNLNLTDNLQFPNIQLDDIILPSIPFIWYREQEIYCPIKSIYRINYLQLAYILDVFDCPEIVKSFNIKNYFLVIQRNVLKNCNLYVCMHSYSYFINNLNKLVSPIMNIDDKYINDTIFNTYTIPITPGIIFLNGQKTLKNGQWNNGSVLIHNKSFSPPGNFNFKVDEDSKILVMLVNGYSNGISNSPFGCLFIVLNDFAESEGDNEKQLYSIFSKIKDENLKNILLKTM